MHTFFDLVVFATGFAACWWSRDAIVRAAIGADAFVRSLEVKINQVKADLRR